MLFNLIILITFLSSLLTLAQYNKHDLPEKILPEGIGVNTHFITGHKQDLNMIAAAGIKFIRQDLKWEITEKIKGQYNWTAYDTLLSEIEHLGIRVIFTLDYNNSLYEKKGLRWGPQDSMNIAGYANWAGAAALHFKGHHILWEIWNEPNTFTLWRPRPNADQYIRMAMAACRSIHKANPAASIIAPALAMFNWNFTKNLSQSERGIRGKFTWNFINKFLKSGILKYLCALSVHAYRDNPPQSPETILPEYEGFKKLLTQYSPGKNIPVISGEWGYTTCNCVQGVSPQTQANWAVRMQLFNMYLGIPITIWYDWKDGSKNLSIRGQNRGLVAYNLKLKPSYIAIFTLTHELSGYYIIDRFEDNDPRDYIFILRNSNGKVKLAAWTQSEAHKFSTTLPLISMPDTIKKLWWINTNADSGIVNVRSNEITIELNATPKFYSTTPPFPLTEFKIESKRN